MQRVQYSHREPFMQCVQCVHITQHYNTRIVYTMYTHCIRRLQCVQCLYIAYTLYKVYTSHQIANMSK